MFDYFNKFGFEEGQQLFSSFVGDARDAFGEGVEVSVQYMSKIHPLTFLGYERMASKDGGVHTPAALEKEEWQKSKSVIIQAHLSADGEGSPIALEFTNGKRRKDGRIAFSCNEESFQQNADTCQRFKDKLLNKYKKLSV